MTITLVGTYRPHFKVRGIGKLRFFEVQLPEGRIRRLEMGWLAGLVDIIRRREGQPLSSSNSWNFSHTCDLEAGLWRLRFEDLDIGILDEDAMARLIVAVGDGKLDAILAGQVTEWFEL